MSRIRRTRIVVLLGVLITTAVHFHHAMVMHRRQAQIAATLKQLEATR